VSAPRTVRRARPALGTIVETGVHLTGDEDAEAAFGRAWCTVAEVERALSVFDPRSDVARFNAAPAGASFPVGAHAAAVLRFARDLERESDGLFDVTLGTGRGHWSLEFEGGRTYIRKHAGRVRIDLGGIGKGYAVDAAFDALVSGLGRAGGAACWVNAGGDIRVGDIEVPIWLRDEEGGGGGPWLSLSDGAIATSRYGPGARSHLAGARAGEVRHVSVAAPRCMWSDALTKVVALSRRTDHPLLRGHHAVAWLHPEGAACH